MAPAFEALIIFSGSVGKECVISGYKHLFLLALKGKERQNRETDFDMSSKNEHLTSRGKKSKYKNQLFKKFAHLEKQADMCW